MASAAAGWRVRRRTFSPPSISPRSVDHDATMARRRARCRSTEQKLACAMLLVAGEALPRGGRLVVGAGAGGPVIDAIGDATSLPAETRAALALETDPSELTTRTVAGLFRRIARGGAGPASCR